jgi:NADH-quinone oxidoreductase subunit L
MTAFYMWRLVAMTFFGTYRGPAWESTGPAAAATATGHGAVHPVDVHAHGQADRRDHEVSHGPAEPHEQADTGQPAHRPAGGHGHGAWHGPHESPTPMTFPLMALALGALVAGFVGIPAALGSGGSAIERFLEPSFTAQEIARPSTGAGRAEGGLLGGESRADGGRAVRTEPVEARADEHESEPASRGVELGLMALSVLIALAGIFAAQTVYVTRPDISDALAARFAGAHKLLSNKYYVDELYGATAIGGTFMAARGLWTFDRRVVDGAVNGTSWATVISAWFSGLTDRTIVDGIVNLVGRTCEEGSFWFRKLQTGLVQNYALLMLFGVFAFVSMYLFLR